MSRSLAGDVRALGAHVGRAFAGLPGWVGGLLAGAQAAVLSLLVVIAPATAAIAAAPTPDGSVSVDWGAGLTVAMQVWLLSHGTPIETALATFTLVPLGLTLISAAIIAAVARRFAAKAWGSWLMVTASYAAVVTGVAAVAGSTPPDVSLVRTAMFAVGIAGPSAAIGIWRAHGAQFPWVDQVPDAVRAGVRLAVATLALVATAASAVMVVAAVAGRQRIAEVATSLSTDAVSGVVLAAAETMYAPVMVVWMMAYLTGVGFTVGEANVYAPSVVAGDALPSVPLLGALPTASGGVLVWAPLLVAAVGAAAWWALHRRWREPMTAVASGVTAVVIVGIGVMVLVELASGAAGPGQLASVGAPPLATGVVAGALAGGGYVLAGALTAGWRWVQRGVTS